MEFQPLRKLEREEDLIWASEFIDLLLALQNIPVDAEKTARIIDALKIMRSIEVASANAFDLPSIRSGRRGKDWNTTLHPGRTLRIDIRRE